LAIIIVGLNRYIIPLPSHRVAMRWCFFPWVREVRDAELFDERPDVWPSVNNVEKGGNVADRGRVSNGHFEGPIKVKLCDIKKC